MSRPGDFLPPEVLDALRRGNAIEVVRRLRESSGRGLGQAKDRVRAQAGSFPAAPTPRDHSRALPPDAAMALARGNRIEAIKLVRHETGLGLKEARDWVEAHWQAHHPTATGLSPGEVPRGEGAWMGLVALAALVLALVAAFVPG